MIPVSVYSWIPRSPQHVFEVAELLSKLKLDVKDINVGESLCFKIKAPERVFDVEFTSYGLFKFTTEVKDASEILKLKEETKRLLVEDIFGIIQKVSYHQIKTGVIPMDYTCVYYTTEKPKKGYDIVKAAGGGVYLGKNPYDPGEDTVVYAKKTQGIDEALDYIVYSKLLASYNKQMISEFSKIYKKMMEVEALIENEDFKVLEEIMKSTDTIKKQSAERYGKLTQALNNLGHAEEKIKQSKNQSVMNALKVYDSFKRLRYDFNYLGPLWSDVLLKTLDNLEFIVNARFELQESIETRKEESEMKLLQAIFLIGVIASILALGAMPGAKIMLYHPDGTLAATGVMQSFSFEDFITYGIGAIVFSILFFAAFNTLYMKKIGKKK
ncbi:MAG: hypothetical protein KKD39_02065 [Candidatus Altiarchaeota archaeon]|nr:hypothetical protein [Candidatus Altiarchaeota archaeon]